MSAKVIVLGSSYSIPDEDHENTHLVVVGEERVVLIDCVGSPLLRLKKAGVEFNQLTDLILTHFHPDHVSGVPILLMDMWLLGRKQPLKVYGLQHTIDRIEELMGLYDWQNWPDFFPVEFFRLPAVEMASVIDCPEMKIIASPVKHLIPTIGLRIDFSASKKALAYSCDTEPCQQVVRLADKVDILIHEATGASPGHSSAGQAGEIAQQANAILLLLIHYPTNGNKSELLISEARHEFNGQVRLAEDFSRFDF